MSLPPGGANGNEGAPGNGAAGKRAARNGALSNGAPSNGAPGNGAPASANRAVAGSGAGNAAASGDKSATGNGAASGHKATTRNGVAADGGSSFQAMWRELLPVGRNQDSGGYRRYAWTGADTECRAWFRAQAEARGLAYEVDRNGNQWAWLGDPLAGDAVVAGSHLDSVPDGGAFDGPLGVVSSFAALDELRRRGVAFTRPLAISNFGDEEGARFGLACVGSRLAAGQLSVEAAHRLRDGDGITLPQAMEAAGHDPDAIGPDPERLARIGAFVELHVEQGRALDLTGDPVGIASAIWPHGRWRFDFRGEANHAGTTRLADRRDPMLTYAETVLAARREAELAGALATFGKISVEPNGVNAIPSSSGAGSTPAPPTRKPSTPWSPASNGPPGNTPSGPGSTSTSYGSPSRPSSNSSTPSATSSARSSRAGTVGTAVAPTGRYPSWARAPDTTRVFCPLRSLPPCCSYGTPPGSRTRRPSTRARTTAWPG